MNKKTTKDYILMRTTQNLKEVLKYYIKQTLILGTLPKHATNIKMPVDISSSNKELNTSKRQCAS